MFEKFILVLYPEIIPDAQVGLTVLYGVFFVAGLFVPSVCYLGESFSAKKKVRYNLVGFFAGTFGLPVLLVLGKIFVYIGG